MKKIKLLTLFLLLIFPSMVFAYGIENFYINATIQENGNLEVEEYFYLNGEYNGFERIINYRNPSAYAFDPDMDSYGGSSLHNGSDIMIEEVRGIPIDANYDFSEKGKEFSEVGSASKGEYGVYTVDYNTNGVSLLIYNPDSYNNAFYIKYTIKNMAILHEDVGELGWNIVGNQLSESIASLKATINIPGNTNVRVWAHGPLNGESKIISNEKLEITIKGLNANTAIDARCTFDKSVISLSKKKSGVKALDKILKYEESKAEQANYQRKQQDKENIIEAENALTSCEKSPTRSCYNDAATKVSHVLDKDKKAEFKLRLEALELLVIEAEETQAKSDVAYAEENPNYKNLTNAQKSVNVLTNKELKRELNERLNKVEKEAKKREKRTDIALSVTIVILVAGMIAITFSTHKKTGKDDPSTFDEYYLRDFPDDFSPATVEYLINGVITNKSVSAEILNMIYKKYITVTKNSDKKDDYTFTFNAPEDKVLTDKERSLRKLLFDSSNSVTLKGFKKKAKTNYSSFLSTWKSFINQSYNEAEGKNLYFFPEEKKKKKLSIWIPICIIISLIIIAGIFNSSNHYEIGSFVGVVCTIIGIITVFVSAFNNTYSPVAHEVAKVRNKYKKRAMTIIVLFIITCGLLSLISVIMLHYYHITPIFGVGAFVAGVTTIAVISGMVKRNEYGSTEYKKWMAMKNFMNDFGNLDEKKLPEIALWEKYLVYATVLGCADKLQKTMEVKLKDMNVDMNTDFSDILLMNTINNTITRAVAAGHSAAVSAKAAHDYNSSGGGSWSSGSGGGGGFSSGGGSFGGGGGGGRF